MKTNIDAYLSQIEEPNPLLAESDRQRAILVGAELFSPDCELEENRSMVLSTGP